MKKSDNYDDNYKVLLREMKDLTTVGMCCVHGFQNLITLAILTQLSIDPMLYKWIPRILILVEINKWIQREVQWQHNFVKEGTWRTGVVHFYDFL